MNYDVAIIGGGPAGATAGTLLKKYKPDLKVVIYEREKFPRDHIGESQLPVISRVLEEMGAFDKIEAANFPVKIGATYRWGKNPELWDFEFIPSEAYVDDARPSKYVGQRQLTAFQVDRSIYDKILLDHAEEMGVEVHQETNVKKIHRTGDKIDAIELGNGEKITAKYYLDASGQVGIIRRAMDVECDYPTSLQNIAIYDYWQNADWSVKIGVGATKILVMSLGYGWIWFIPLGPTRTSIGLVVPADYYKKTGLRPEQLYLQALAEDETISGLIKNATREHKFTTTKDWSFLAKRQSGENWFLIGECAGFADPILSAGMSMAHCAGREVACTILELERGKLDPEWLKGEFDLRQAQRVTSHIRFADYWYTANAQFVDIKECIQGIAKDAGLNLGPNSAWNWLAQGGFIDENLYAGVGGFPLFVVKSLGSVLSDLPSESQLETCNEFRLNLAGASYKAGAKFSNGGVTERHSYVRDGKVLPIEGRFEVMVNVLQRNPSMEQILNSLNGGLERMDPRIRERVFAETMEAFEAMIEDGWVVATYNPAKPKFSRENYIDKTIRPNSEIPVYNM